MLLLKLHLRRKKKKQIAREVIINDLRRDKTAHDARVDPKYHASRKSGRSLVLCLILNQKLRQ